MEAVVNQLAKLLPDISIVPGESLCWSPKSKTIIYRKDDPSSENIWGLLHEAGHADLKHEGFRSDMELLLIEVSAWENAIRLAENIGEVIDEEHVQDCLDTYRDWLHQRSTCPRCGIVTFQRSTNIYSCYNCDKQWTVSPSRLCRPYRLSSEYKKNRPEIVPEAVFKQEVRLRRSSS